MKNNHISLYQNPNGLASRRIILLILSAPCLKWIENIFNNNKNIHVKLNSLDCNNPIEFYNEINEYANHPNVIKIIHLKQKCGTVFKINNTKVPLIDYNITGKSRDTILSDLRKISEKSNITKKINVKPQKFKIAIKCGGSTKISQNKLNPFIGKVVDRLIDLGFHILFNEPQESIGLDEEIKIRCNLNDFNKWKTFIDKLNYDNPYINKGNIQSGIKNLTEKSLGSFRKTGSKNFKVYNLDEKIGDNCMSFILGTNQEPESQNQMIRKGALICLFITGQDLYFGTSISPTFTVGLNHLNGNNEFDYIYKNNFENEVELCVSNILSALSGKDTISEKYIIR